MEKYKEYLGLGIAGNFALHLAQAGELEDFKNVVTTDESAPKGIFPFYLPCQHQTNNQRPRTMLSTYPLSSDILVLPKEPLNVQAEPEVALLCDISYKDGKVASLTPKLFGAYNDASIRVAGAEKISDKKNWGRDTKGVAKELLEIDTFCEGGSIDRHSICSFLRRNGELHAYGEDVSLKGYSYFHQKLVDWIMHQINTQKDFGPLEDIKSYIKTCNNPQKCIISIGATRYTPYGESTFLQSGDEVLVAVYDNREYTLEDIYKILQTSDYNKPALSILAQKVR